MTILECVQGGSYVDLVALTKKYKEDRKMSDTELSVRTGLSRTTVSQYLAGAYGSNPKNIEEKLAAYLTEQGVTLEEGQDSFKPGEMLYQSTDARRIMAVCSACQSYSKLGVVAGKSGYGKSHTLVMYSRLPKVAYIECNVIMSQSDLVRRIAQELGVNPGLGTSCQKAERLLENLHDNPGWLIIMDEADKLISKSSQSKMEILRMFTMDSKINHKKPFVGIVLAGEEQLIPPLKSYNERMNNRGTCWYKLNGLSKKEAGEYLSRLPMDEDIKDTLIERACDMRRGCFRRLDQTLDNILRLMRDRGSEQVTQDILAEASGMMML